MAFLGGAGRWTSLASQRMSLVNQKREMASLKDLKTRMKSVSSVKKITASMKTVATSKLKAAELRKDIAVPFHKASFSVLADKYESLKPQSQHLIIVVTSDRGLCGSVNSSVARHVRSNFKPTNPYDLVCIGDKGKAALTREYGKSISLQVSELDKKPVTFADVIPVAEEIAKKNFESATIVTNKFITILSFETTKLQLPSQQRMLQEFDFSSYEIEDDYALEDLYLYSLASTLFSAIVENQACELGARMVSMDNATKNAGEMLNAITISYNKKRQAAITTELVEIISGAQSMEAQA